MMKSKNPKNIPVPPADIILELLNDEAPVSDEEILRFYEDYIRKVATTSIYTVNGAFCGTYINEDLMQEMSIALVRSLPSLRRNVHNHLTGKCVLVFVTPAVPYDKTE